MKCEYTPDRHQTFCPRDAEYFFIMACPNGCTSPGADLLYACEEHIQMVRAGIANVCGKCGGREEVKRVTSLVA
jgi:hypothetical protein